MTRLSEKVQDDLLLAIENDDLVLPTLPEVALTIREAAEDSEVSVARLTHVVGQDPALSARLIKVVNSPMLRGSVEATNLQTAINRLGINYTCNLAIGLVIEQIFHARAPAVAQRMREAWKASLEVAGISSELCRRFTSLMPDQAALAGLVHQIGILPILTYAQDRDELLSDPVCLHHVIENIHSLVGDRILASWDFPPHLAGVPGHCLDTERQHERIDYADLVLLARLLNQPDNSGVERLYDLPAFHRLGAGLSALMLAAEVQQAKVLFY